MTNIRKWSKARLWVLGGVLSFVCAVALITLCLNAVDNGTFSITSPAFVGSVVSLVVAASFGKRLLGI